MRKRDRKELGRYVRAIADEMSLRDWTFDVELGDADEGKDARPDGSRWGASCAPVPGRKFATITLAPGQREEDPAELRQTVVHELTHCHFFGLWDTVRNDTLLPLGQQTYDMFIANIERHMEYGVDAMADALAPHMPLIEWPS
jgi:hypothetical protein